MSFPLLSDATRNTVVYVKGDREPGGNFCTYAIHEKTMDDGNQLGIVVFQHGPVKEHGVNGVTEEDLLSICIHRLTCFQTGPYACDENNRAITYLHAALASLHERTANRMMRKVEGTSQV